MKDNDTILSLQETEELCRLYMDCQLSVLEERELQYILGRLSYSSPVIEEAKSLMMAEGIVFSEKKERKKKVFRWGRRALQVAASLTILLSLSILITHWPGTESRHADSYMAQTNDADANEVVIAYERGKRLNTADSERAVNEALKRAESLMAMAKARDKEDEIKQNYILNLTSGIK